MTGQCLKERYHAARDEFTEAVVKGLSRSQKSLPSRYFYDSCGSGLFERITELPEYYLYRVETELLRGHAPDLVNGFASDGMLIEFGSGSSTKTELLLAELAHDTSYVPIDVSRDALDGARARLARRFPALQVWPVVADFCSLNSLPDVLPRKPRLGFFPGSTIGNFVPAEALRLLQRFKALLEPHGRLIIGVDLVKDPRILERAYNDAQGVTAAFNLNLIARINREIAPVVDPDAFSHSAFYNARESRIEMHLLSRRDQSFVIAGQRIAIAAGETIHTENSYKYSVAGFQDLARRAGWAATHVWTDRDDLFSIHELS